MSQPAGISCPVRAASSRSSAGHRSQSHVALGESGDRLPDRRRAHRPGQARPPPPRSTAGCAAADPGVGQAEPGRPQPRAGGCASRRGRRRRDPGRATGPQRRPSPAERRRGSSSRADTTAAGTIQPSPGCASMHPQLQVPARPDRREQGGQVIVEVARGRGPAPRRRRAASRGRSARRARSSPAGRGLPHAHAPRRPARSPTQAARGSRPAARPGLPGGQPTARRPPAAGCGPDRAGTRRAGGSISSRSACPAAAVSWRRPPTSTGPSACSRCQRQRKPDRPVPSSPASRQTWTEAVLHIMSRPHGPVAVEELLHRRVPRQVEHPERRSERVESLPVQAETRLVDGLPERGKIPACDRDALAETSRGSGAEFHLAARLGGERSPVRAAPRVCPAGRGRRPRGAGPRLRWDRGRRRPATPVPPRPGRAGRS